jgi:hypothetical protein
MQQNVINDAITKANNCITIIAYQITRQIKLKFKVRKCFAK